MGHRACKPATKSERARITAAKLGPCVACTVRLMAKLLPVEWVRVGERDGLNEYHHTKSGNIRRGHRFGFALCCWHHRGRQAMPLEGMTHNDMRDRWGPSLADGSATFHALYGEDDELIEIQDAILARDA